MKASIQSTTEVVEISDPSGRRANARVWEGVTAGGVRFTAYITCVQVLTKDQGDEFERDLLEHKRPEDWTQRAIDLRFVI